MNIHHVVDGLPLWVIFIASVIVIVSSSEVGFLLGKRHSGKGSTGRKISTGPVVASSLGLMAFMLAFTFGAVASRFDDRKDLVLEEANAIGTAFLRADLLPRIERDRMQKLLYDYISLRIEAVESGDAEQIEQALIRSEAMQNEMWSMAVSFAGRDRSPVAALFLQSLNQVIDLQQKRVTVSTYHRMPAVFWFTLCGLAILSMVIGGYENGLSGGRRSITTRLVVSIAFSMVLILIVALERPFVELASVSQAALIDVQQGIKSPFR